MNASKSWTICKIVLVVLATLNVLGRAHSPNEHDTLSKETQTQGYWVDPSTGLMWAAKDNGKNVNWHQATSYCRKLHVGGYADWRLATIEELERIQGADACQWRSCFQRSGSR
jgi:hypothetical protein